MPVISYARSVDGVVLAFMVTGNGPPVVQVPWVPFSNLQMEWENPLYRGVFEHMGRHLTLVQYDGRGTGHSQRDVADLSLDAMVADIEAVVERAGHKQFSLWGQYISCPHVLAYAARNPDRVQRVALFGGGARSWLSMNAQQTQALLSLIEQDWDLFVDTAAHQWLGWSAGEAGRQAANALRGAVTPQVARATLQAASAVDVSDELANVTAPVLVLHRRGMTQIPVGVSRSLAESLPHGRMLSLEGSQPWLFGDRAEAVVDLLVRFFRDGVEPPESTAVAGSLPDINADLTPREVAVLRLLAAGGSNAEIARDLALSVHTVERHIANVYRKIDARGRADATSYELRHGLV